MAKIIESNQNRKLILITGRAHPQLAEEIAYQLGIELVPVTIYDFANGEIYAQISESVRGADVYVIESHVDPINKTIMENLLLLDALKRASTRSITAVVPFLGYARQDKKHKSREPIAARMVIDLLETAGAQRLISVDLHSDQIQGFFNGPVDHLEAQSLLIKWVQHNVKDLDNLVVVSPDAGRTKTSEKWAAALGGIDVAFIHKKRDINRPNVSVSDAVIGDVNGKTCLITDDLIDTGGTIISAVKLLKKNKAKKIYVLATHGVFSKKASENLQKCAADAVVVTNTLPIPKKKQFNKLEIISIAPLIANAISLISQEKSLGTLFPTK